MTKLNDEGQESILEEAHRITHGDRNDAYGHPFDDYACTAAIATAILGDKLKEPITAHEMALLMCGVKLSRESRVSKRDNLVDLAGYAWVARMCQEEKERREAPPVVTQTHLGVQYGFVHMGPIDKCAACLPSLFKPAE